MVEKIKTFVTEGDDVGLRWTKWLVRFDLYLKVLKLDDDEERVNNLLFYVGESAHDKYLAVANVSDKYADVVSKLNIIFNPPVNKQMNVFKFRNLSQQVGEPFDEFLSRLRASATSCEFGSDQDNQIKSQVIQGCVSLNLRRNALEKENLLLSELIKMGQNTEAVDDYMVSSRRSTACGYQGTAGNSVGNINRLVDDSNRKGIEKKCFKCGGVYPHVREYPCPAIGANCNRCGKLNHLENCCKLNPEWSFNRNKRINLIQSFEDELAISDEDAVWALKSNCGKLPSIKLEMCKSLVEFTIDTGASCNVLDEVTWSKLVIKPVLCKTNIKLFAYGSNTPLVTLGEFKARALINGIYQSFMVLVVEGSRGCVLGHESLLKMGIVKIINQLEFKDPLVDQLALQYPNVFS